MNLNKMVDDLTIKLKQKLEINKNIYKKNLENAVIKNLYLAYTPKYYERTYSLLDSITMSDIRIENNILTFDLYFDPNKLEHWSVVSGSNIYKGKSIYTPPLLDEGHFEDGYSEVDYFHNYPGREFLSDALMQLKKDLQLSLKNLVYVELKKLGGKNKY